MAKKLEKHLNCFADESEEAEFLSYTQPMESDPLSWEWLRRDPHWTTDRLMDLQPGESREQEGI